MKIFITGATGFIGKNLVKKLVELNYKVTVNIHSVKPFNLPNTVETYRLNENEIKSDIDFFKKSSFSGVIHLASLYLTSHKPEDISRLIDTNLKFSSHILECASKAKVPWFINTGTFWQNLNNCDYSPVNLYSATKQAFESIAKYYIESNQIKFCTIRLSDTFGPNDKRPKIFNLWKKNANSSDILHMSPGNQMIDISYIDDVVSAFILLAKHLDENNVDINNGDVFAVMAEKRYSLKELAKIFEQTTGLKLNINWGGRPYKEREIMIPWESGKVIPGWKSKYSIREGLLKTIK